MAKGSFSIWVNLCSVLVSALEAYATGLSCLSCCLWSNTAPSPYEDVSAETTVFWRFGVPVLVVCWDPFWYYQKLSVVYLPMSTCFLLSTELRGAVFFLLGVEGICFGDLPSSGTVWLHSHMLALSCSKPSKIWDILFWKFCGAEDIPKHRRLKHYLPNGVINVVRSAVKGNCQNPE